MVFLLHVFMPCKPVWVLKLTEKIEVKSSHLNMFVVSLKYPIESWNWQNTMPTKQTAEITGFTLEKDVLIWRLLKSLTKGSQYMQPVPARREHIIYATPLYKEWYTIFTFFCRNLYFTLKQLALVLRYSQNDCVLIRYLKAL